MSKIKLTCIGLFAIVLILLLIFLGSELKYGFNSRVETIPPTSVMHTEMWEWSPIGLVKLWKSDKLTTTSVCHQMEAFATTNYRVSFIVTCR